MGRFRSTGFSSPKAAVLYWLLPLSLIFCFPSKLLAQNDALILTNGDQITGEIKKLDRGIIEIDADYGDSNFFIEWQEVERIESSEYFIVETSAGIRIIGSIRTDPEQPTLVIIKSQDRDWTIRKANIVFLELLEKGFWSRLGISIDFGLSITKAEETKQFTARTSLSYQAENWTTSIKYNSDQSIREGTDTTSRNELNGNYRRQLTVINDQWFYTGFASFLQSSESKLDLRSTLGAGVGRYLRRTNRWLLSATGGAAWTNENYTETAESTDNNSGELVGSVELNIFNIGDLDVFTTFSVYPSISELGRVRMKLNTDFRWEFFRDFFIAMGFINDFDSATPEGTSKNDYVFTTTIGWSH